MIGVEIDGRLGNQMFQYAFALSIARQLKTKFFLCSYHLPLLIHKYFILKSFNFPLNQLQNKVYQATEGKWKRVEFDNQLLPFEQLSLIANSSIFKGYFQSEEYFFCIKNQIQEEFQIKKKFLKLFKRVANDHDFSDKIIIHYRGTDYLKSGFLLPGEYYSKCLNLLNIKDEEVLVISDDPIAAKKAFPKENFKVLKQKEPIIDFQIMMNARRVIISNSSFAWWACYLNKQPNKEILAPRNWLGYNLGREDPVHIMNDSFCWI